MNRQFVPNFEILLMDRVEKFNDIKPTSFISHGNCYLTYVGNFLIVEITSNPTSDTVENRFIPYNLDDVKTFRYSTPLKNYVTT